MCFCSRYGLVAEVGFANEDCCLVDCCLQIVGSAVLGFADGLVGLVERDRMAVVVGLVVTDQSFDLVHCSGNKVCSAGLPAVLVVAVLAGNLGFVASCFAAVQNSDCVVDLDSVGHPEEEHANTDNFHRFDSFHVQSVCKGYPFS